MYLPKHFSQNETQAIRELITQNGFATLLSFPENQLPFINHLPLVFSTLPGEEEILIGHMAKRNPQWIHFKKNPQSVVIIQGPHAYITPTWYQSGRDVPTWNYAVAHLSGKIELVEKFDAQVETLKQISTFYEAPSPNPWQFELPDDLLDEASLTTAIVSFKFHIEKIDAKFKFSQNRSKEDRDGVIDGLGQRSDDLSKAVRAIMIENEKRLEKRRASK